MIQIPWQPKWHLLSHNTCDLSKQNGFIKTSMRREKERNLENVTNVIKGLPAGENSYVSCFW